MPNRSTKKSKQRKCRKRGRPEKVFCPECLGTGEDLNGPWGRCKVCAGDGMVPTKVYHQIMKVRAQEERRKWRFVKQIAQTQEFRHVDSVKFSDGQHFRIFRLGGG